MKKYHIFIFTTLLLLGGSCATLEPLADPKPSPKSLGVYAMEIEACGELGVDTSACVFTQTEVPSGEVRIRVPRTNTTETVAQLELVSAECNYEESFSAFPGETVAIKVADILKPGKSCSLQVVLNVVWDRQATFTFPVTPLVGRVLLLTLEHPLTEVGSATLGFKHSNELAAAQSGPDFTVDTQGSSFGQVLYFGCGLSSPVTVSYSTPNPVVSLPKLLSSCILFGTVQRLDRPGSLSFAIARTLVPGTYERLVPPTLTLRVGQSDPFASAVDVGAMVTRGGKFRIPKSLASLEYNVRQVTTSGRFSISHIKNGAVEWSLP